MSNLKINEDIQVGETNIKFSELISTIQNFNTSKLVFSGAHVGQNISANTFSLGSFNISPSVIDTKFLSINSSGILTVEKEGFYRIEWMVRWPDISSSTDVFCGCSIDDDVLDNAARGNWMNYVQRGTSTGVTYLKLVDGQTIRPKFWSSTSTTMVGTGYYYITYVECEVS